MRGFATLKQAIEAAERRYAREPNPVYIVLADEYDEGPRYHLASDEEMDTWFAGDNPVYCIPA